MTENSNTSNTAPTTSSTCTSSTKQRTYQTCIQSELHESLFGQIRDLPEHEYMNDHDLKEISNFLAVPFYFERFAIGGLFVCIDIFLSTLVYLPFRGFLAAVSVLFGYMPSIARLHDVLTCTIIFTSAIMLYAIRISLENAYLTINNIVAVAAWTGMMETFDDLLIPLGEFIRY